MVAHPRKTSGPGALRPVKASVKTPVKPANPESLRSLNLPMPIEVEEDAQQRPVSVTLPPSAARMRPPSSPRQSTGNQRRAAPKGRTLKTTSIDDLWQVDDEWWRETPISRRYYQITAEDERRLTIFQDRTNGNWYWQKGGG